MTPPDGTNSFSRRATRAVFHPYTNAVANDRDGPLVIMRGEGVRVWDEDGKEYIEGMAGLWCASLGFSEHRLADAAARQMRTLPFYHGFSHKSHAPQIELAERLLELAPAPMGRVFFCNSGSEAIDTAVKLIWYYNNTRGKPEKKKIISRVKAYHGVTVAAASATGVPANHTNFDLPIDRFLHTDLPHFYRFGAAGETEEDFATRCADNLESMILAEDPETVAAFFAEPVMGAGGVIVPPATYFDKIQAVLKKYDILLLADEVICGFGRTGRMWGSETFGLKPDLLTTAKALTSGYIPISALMVSKEIYETVAPKTAEIGTFGHGYTYSGHPVAAAVALETLDIYAEMDVVERVRSAAVPFQKRLAALAGHPLVGETMGIGLIGAIELVADRDTRAMFEPAGKTGPYAVSRAQAHGAILRPLVDRVAFSPPLIISDADIGLMFDRAEAALDDTAAWLKAGGLTGN